MNEPILRRNSLTPHLTWTVFTALFSLLLGYMSRDIWFYGPFLLVALLLNLFMFPRMGGFVEKVQEHLSDPIVLRLRMT